MKLLTLFFILNALFLLLHEIESAFEKEWEIFKLPGNITGFLLMHIPVILLLFYGVLEVEKSSKIGGVIGIIAGIGGTIPFIVHKLLIRKKGRFNRLFSDIVIFSNIPCGIITAILSLRLAA
jgi:hypothetical protein